MTRRLRELYHADVISAKGKRIGRVVDALFDHEEPVVVGYLVERPRLLLLFDRKERHLAHDAVRLTGNRLEVANERAAWDKSAASRLGLDWDLTVIWSNMPVRTEAGASLGRVRDARYDPKSGDLVSLSISTGTAADLAVGAREIPGHLVKGYRDGSILVTEEAAKIEMSGGAAAVAGRGSAVAKVQVQQAAKTATAYGKAAAKVARESETGKKAMGWLKSMKDEITDAMGDSDDD
ncbi:MAG TPA: PRC-barrel domain-containing protein [Coriobacteriia bacterium]|nr:PRC-barrel domain-containing protein [Coriobacteriia bacterium]